MQTDTDRMTASHGRIRRFIFYYVAALMLTCQGLFLLLELGFDFDPRFMVWLVPAPIPIGLAVAALLIEGPEPARQEPRAWTSWALAGLAMFGLWAGSYFVVGKVTDPSRVRFLPAILEAHIPLRPSFTLLYITLYPIFGLPFFVVRERPMFQRLVAGYLLMFVACSIAFLAIPIAFDRPPLPPPPHDFGTWVLSIVRGTDPAWNCMPSEHCTAAMIAALATWEACRKAGAFALLGALLIGVSTLFTKQHYVVDVLAGYGLAFAIHWALRWAKSFEPWKRQSTVNGRRSTAES